MQDRQDEVSPRAGPVFQRTFSDLDELAAEIHTARVEFAPLASPWTAEARFLRIDLGDGVTLQSTQVGIPHVTRGQVEGRIAQTIFAIQPAEGLSWNGNPVDDRTACHYREGSEFQVVAPHTALAVGITFPAHRLETATVTLARADPGPGRENCRVSRLDDSAREGLRAIVQRALAVVREDPGAFAVPEARRSLAESLVASAVRARGDLPRHLAERERTMLSHSRIVAAAEECMRARLGEPLYVSDLCMATGASERTLRSAFRNVYGMGPNRLLKLRRIHQVRRELERGDDRTLVSEVAQRHGFWDLGRFAGDYRAVVGEPPSQTLRRSRVGLIA